VYPDLYPSIQGSSKSQQGLYTECNRLGSYHRGEGPATGSGEGGRGYEALFVARLNWPCQFLAGDILAAGTGQSWSLHQHRESPGPALPATPSTPKTYSSNLCSSPFRQGQALPMVSCSSSPGSPPPLPILLSPPGDFGRSLLSQVWPSVWGPGVCLLAQMQALVGPQCLKLKLEPAPSLLVLVNACQAVPPS
jgi:hypothetical protein